MISIPNYRFDKKIYESANSIVYRGMRNSDNLPVILKTLKTNYPSAEELTRYHQEYQIICSFKNLDGIVDIYSLEKYKNTPIICMEDFGGESLIHWLETRSLTLTEQLKLAIDIAKILAHIHQNDVIHKDINPSNIIWNPNADIVKIVDFGISTQFSKQHLALKNPEVLEGTLPYISPEQTGRMNRAVDYRSDFYSLGITFYQLFTGKLPFDTQDAMELVHSHLAKQPVAPHLVNPQLPLPISHVITKLLAKTAEERYQSAWGVHADLQRCYDALDKTGQIDTFELAQKDMSDHFYIPQKLYGRENEIASLLAAFERVANGTAEIMLIAGYSGIGKSVLVKEIYRSLTKRNGYFISGKFDQLQRNVPYSALINAFKELVQQLLTENEIQLAQWKEKLLKTLGANGQVIIDVIPEIEQIIGEQPPIPELGPAESQNRFNLVFQNFVHVFCHVDHPLALFLDDLQWVDSATLKLLKLIAENKDNTALFLIGAYRDNEVSSTHPLTLTLKLLHEEKVTINQITLKPLAFEHVNQLIADSVHQNLTASEKLTHLVIKKTEGNPFFVNQFLHSLYKEELLRFVPPTLDQNAYWQWDVQQIEAVNITDNVVDLMIGKLKKLPQSAQSVIILAACIGNHFDLETLAIVYEKPIFDTFQDLMPLLMEGLILPKSESQAINHANDTHLVIHQLRFLHDRVQQAAYALIDESDKKAVHLQIGRLLLENTPELALAERIFDIVEQFDQSIELVCSETERHKIAQLNLLAGQKAKQANAYKAAINYLAIGRSCLANDSWENDYELTCQLFAEGAEAAYLNGDIEQMETLAQMVSQHAHSFNDEIRICEIRIEAYTGQNQLVKSIQIALEFLKRLGIDLPEEPTSEDVKSALQTMSVMLKGRSIKKLIDLPNMTVTNESLAMRVMVAIMPATYHLSPNLMILSAVKQVELSLQYGNAPGSSFGYVGYGFILCTEGGGAIEFGYQLGQLGLKLSEKIDPSRLQVRVFEIFNVLVRPWKEPVRASLQPLLENYHRGLEVGDLEFASYSICVRSHYSYFAGQELNAFEKEIGMYTREVTQIKRENMVGWNRLYWQVSLNLLGRSHDPCRIVGDVYDENVQLPQHEAMHDRTAIHFFYLNRCILNFLFKRKAQAIEDAKNAEAHLDGVVGLLLTAIFYFYDSLIQLSIYEEVDEKQQAEILNKVTANQKRMDQWAHHAPMNFLHKYYLVEAEKARILGHHGEAREYYDQAIELAEKNEYIQEAALAYELAGQFYLVKHNSSIAQIYLRDAHYAYQQWGATTKVKDLTTRYAELLMPKVTENLLSNFSVGKTTILATPSIISTSSNNVSQWLDLSSIMKASQTLSSEIVLSKLLEKMMKIVLENAGAEKGYLLLPKQGKWFIEAEIHINNDTVTVLRSLNVAEQSLLATNILQYVLHTKDAVVLDDAIQAKQFSQDSYILKMKPKSLLCMPLLHYGAVNGILYLENNLTQGAFTSQRLEMLNLLSSQLAISIQNALFYAELEDKVDERTTELKQQTVALEKANESLVQLNQEKNEFLGIAAHDLKNPLAAIQGSAEYIQEEFDELPQEELIDSIEMIETASRKMFSLITNLLDVNAIEEGQMKVNLQLVDILPTLQEVVNEYTKKAATKNITVHFSPEQDSYFAYVDPNTVHQILDNLISNAVKYSPLDKNVFIRIISQTDMIRIEIQDEGQGLSQADQAKLFHKFTRLTTKPTGGEHSTGLGLFIVKKLVNALQGDIWCESELGKGATFILTIPCDN